MTVFLTAYPADARSHPEPAGYKAVHNVLAAIQEIRLWGTSYTMKTSILRLSIRDCCKILNVDVHDHLISYDRKRRSKGKQIVPAPSSTSKRANPSTRELRTPWSLQKAIIKKSHFAPYILRSTSEDLKDRVCKQNCPCRTCEKNYINGISQLTNGWYLD